MKTKAQINHAKKPKARIEKQLSGKGGTLGQRKAAAILLQHYNDILNTK